LSNNLATALARLRDEMDLCDGHSDHTPGASAPEARTPVLMEGNCREYIAGAIQCGKARPCGEHDVNDTRLSPVERAAARSAVLERARSELLDAIGALLRATDHAERRVRRWSQPDPIDTKNMLCHGTATYPGYHVPLRDGGWYDELCKKVADPTKGGLCDACWGREVAWRASQNLPPRERTNVAVVRDIPMCVRGDGNTATPGRNDGLCNACRLRDSRARSKAS
jgi:hypothetical protein